MALQLIIIINEYDLFLLAKVPFPLTYRFKAMLQRGVELKTLSASWYDHTS